MLCVAVISCVNVSAKRARSYPAHCFGLEPLRSVQDKELAKTYDVKGQLELQLRAHPLLRQWLSWLPPRSECRQKLRHAFKQEHMDAGMRAFQAVG